MRKIYDCEDYGTWLEFNGEYITVHNECEGEDTTEISVKDLTKALIDLDVVEVIVTRMVLQ